MTGHLEPIFSLDEVQLEKILPASETSFSPAKNVNKIPGVEVYFLSFSFCLDLAVS